MDETCWLAEVLALHRDLRT